MELRWLGHAAFYVESPAGLRVVSDPFGEDVTYPPIDVECDVVTISHNHDDHNVLTGIKGAPKILRGVSEEKGLFSKVSWDSLDSSFTSFPSFHDDQKGALRGENAIFRMDLGGVTLAHMGDLGHFPEPSVMDAMKGVDILLIPVGGHYTVGSEVSFDVARALSPKVVVPMHYLTPFISSWPIKGPQDFLAKWDHVKNLDTDVVYFEKNTLPQETQVWVFHI